MVLALDKVMILDWVLSLEAIDEEMTIILSTFPGQGVGSYQNLFLNAPEWISRY